MKYLLWMAVPLLVVGAVMLLTGIGAPGVWIAVIAVSLALIGIDLGNQRARGRR